MLKAIQMIDEALRQIYEIDTPERPENFLLDHPVGDLMVAAPSLQGALYVHGDREGISVGIYIDEATRETLATFGQWNTLWSLEQLQAFVVAAEEISHFHYFLFHASRGRSLSQLELELQGEIDKFLLCAFAQQEATFEEVFDSLFLFFRFAEEITQEQRDRYAEANRLARLFIQKHAKDLFADSAKRERAFRHLRRFYRLPPSEKISRCLAYFQRKK